VYFVQKSVSYCFIVIVFIFASENAIVKVQEIEVELEFNGTHNLFVYVDANILRDGLNAIKRNRESPIFAIRRVV
jgi:hypothetical protein